MVFLKEITSFCSTVVEELVVHFLQSELRYYHSIKEGYRRLFFVAVGGSFSDPPFLGIYQRV